MLVVLNFHPQAPPGRHEHLGRFLNGEYTEVFAPANVNRQAPLWHQVQMLMKTAEQRVMNESGRSDPDFLILPEDPGIAYLLAHYRKLSQRILVPAFVLRPSADPEKYYYVQYIVKDREII